MELSEVIKGRYSVRNYSDRKIEKDILDEVIAAGMLAPTAKNSQRQ